jgi:hypothetical protein
MTTPEKKPRPAGGPGGALLSGLPLRRSGPIVQAGFYLLDHLNDATRAWLDQHGLAVHHGVAIGVTPKVYGTS